MLAATDINKVHDLGRAIEIGYAKCLRDYGLAPKSISKRMAHKKYTKLLVDDWDSKGLTFHKKIGDGENSTILYDDERLQILYAATIGMGDERLLKKRKYD